MSALILILILLGAVQYALYVFTINTIESDRLYEVRRIAACPITKRGLSMNFCSWCSAPRAQKDKHICKNCGGVVE